MLSSNGCCWFIIGWIFKEYDENRLLINFFKLLLVCDVMELIKKYVKYVVIFNFNYKWFVVFMIMVSMKLYK